MAKEKRFDVILVEGSQMTAYGHRYVLVDRETGVQYLLWQLGHAGGLTPLLDKDGKPLLYE